MPRRPGGADRGPGRTSLVVAGVLTRSARFSGHQREHQWEFPGSAWRQHPPSLSILDEELDLPLEERVLDEGLDHESSVDQGCDDLAETVVPRVFGLVTDLR